MRKITYILTLLFVMALMFTGCTKLDVIDPAGDVEQLDYRVLDGDDMDADDDDASTGCGGDDIDDDDEDDDTGGITDEDDDEDEDDSDTQRGSTSTI
jgi:hypothetical protein